MELNQLFSLILWLVVFVEKPDRMNKKDFHLLISKKPIWLMDI